MSAHTRFHRDWVADRLQVALDAAECDGLLLRFEGLEADQVRLAESTIVQSSVLAAGTVDVHAVVGRSEAFTSTTDLSDEGLVRAVRTAAQRARDALPSAEEPRLATPSRLPESGGLDERTASLSARDKAGWLEAALSAHRNANLALAGRFHSGLSTRAVRSTTGIDAYHQGTFANTAFTALEAPTGHAASSYRARLDAAADRARVEALTAEVLEECLRAKNPVSIEPGEWDVILSPAAVVDLMDWMALIGFNSRAWEDGLSFQCERIDQRITGAAVDIVDDASMPAGLGVPVPFDGEGQPKQRVPLIEAGVAKGIVHDSRSAQRAGCATTGHANSGMLDETGSSAAHLHFGPGESDLEALVGQVERGLYVTHLHYVNGFLEPRRAVMTGLIRDAAFLIEGGKLGRAVTPLRFTESVLEAFARIPGKAGVGSELEPHESGFGAGCAVAPALLVPRLCFTSKR